VFRWDPFTGFQSIGIDLVEYVPLNYFV